MNVVEPTNLDGDKIEPESLFDKKAEFKITVTKKDIKTKKSNEMISQIVYYVVFYDISKPKTYPNAMQKRVEEKTWLNLVDGMPNKSVQLRATEDAPLLHYEIINHCTFHVYNTIDNCFYGIFDCKKVKAHNLYPVHHDKITT